ncbi:MAG TPA: cysteine hydrolase [Janthinobacterium sp.]|jgi:nicotinamidase-related amidase|nr:cysteine hydrolase [Janthinobacterium sp.]
MKRHLHLLIIDPQNDFCDLPEKFRPLDPVRGVRRAPALPVPGAHRDMLRLAELIELGRAGLSGISVTLDSHHRYDIAHPTFWMAGDGAAVAPFTEIRAAQVRAGAFVPRSAAALPRALAYLDALEAAGRYHLMVWPVHCEIGSWGQNVHDKVRAAYNRWEEAGPGIVAKVNKGANPWTEHYSAVMAEVPDQADPETQLNRAFIDGLSLADRIYIAGEAGSHCVKASTEHIVDHFAARDVAKLVLLTDCISPVAGFEARYQDFLRAMAARGVTLAQSGDALPELLMNARL